MIAHAREEAPNECCGVIAGQDGRAVKLFRVRNADASPYRYRMDIWDQVSVHHQCYQKGWEFLAIYHSHTVCEAYPSPADISLSWWPATLCVVVSLMQPDAPVVRAFHIVDGEAREAVADPLPHPPRP